MAQKPLAPKQHQAADMIGAGHTYAEAAAEVGVAARTVRRWTKREDFAAAVKQRRGAELDANPSARATLEAALQATHASGKPDWRTRVSAARALVGSEGDDPEDGKVAERVTYINREALDGGD